MQTFRSQIAANRRNSVLLVLIVIGLLVLMGFSIGYALSGEPTGGLGLMGVAGVLAIVMSLAAYFSGDRLVLAASGAREITEQDAPQLYNVVREMSIAANVPVPRVYIIDDTAPNAFATGRDPKHASVAATTGLLEKLDREELQGVIGHEMSHVANLDVRFALLVGVLVGVVALISDMFLRSAFWFGGGRRSSSREGGGLAAIMFVVAIVLAILAPIAARLVQLAVSRQREYLADATSVELTRNPYGLQRALAKIATDTEVLEVANRATQHMYITNPIKKFESRRSGLFSTHPPIVDRINRLRVLTGETPLSGQTLGTLAGLD
ncbi:MAG TPA: zinc metalloprotease HtpX [Candidatus Limnocylindrales bacterium]|nr:zinc metalloprotease HtpX [Candidatus Limnocylindrales bacterium]